MAVDRDSDMDRERNYNRNSDRAIFIKIDE